MMVVPKQTSKIRICVAGTKPNAWVKREKHPLLHVEQLLDQLSGAKYFFKLDAKSGFWQIKSLSFIDCVYYIFWSFVLTVYL